MAVGKGSIQRATRALQEDNKEKAVFTEVKKEAIEEVTVEEKKTPTKKSGARKTTATKKAEPAKETTFEVKKAPAKKPAAKKTAPKKKGAAVVVEEKKETKKTYEQISRIKSDLPIHLL